MLRHARKVILKNGTRTILVPHEDSASATLLVLYAVGSRYETPRDSGSAHFIEHMMFKGTRKRRSTFVISRDLDGLGADYNAFTAKDYTGYYIRLPAKRLDLAVDMLHDMLHDSLFRQGDIGAERQVILEELRMYEDSPSDLVEELLDEELYDGSPLGMRIGGTVSSVSALTRKQLLTFRGRYYRPQRTVIALAGRFDSDEAVRLLDTSFGRTPRRGRGAAYAPFRRGRSRRPRIRLRHRETEQVQIALGFPAYSRTDRRIPALTLLNTVLGGTMSSRLFINVREKEGLCYSIRSSANPYGDTGDLSVHAGLAKDRVDRALGLIFRELRRIRDKDVTAEELKRAKEFVRGKTLLSFEDSSRVADWFARQELLTDRMEDPEERLARIFAVRKEDIRRVAAEVIRKDALSLAVVGPFKDAKRFMKHADALS